MATDSASRCETRSAPGLHLLARPSRTSLSRWKSIEEIDAHAPTIALWSNATITSAIVMLSKIFLLSIVRIIWNYFADWSIFKDSWKWNFFSFLKKEQLKGYDKSKRWIFHEGRLFTRFQEAPARRSFELEVLNQCLQGTLITATTSNQKYDENVNVTSVRLQVWPRIHHKIYGASGGITRWIRDFSSLAWIKSFIPRLTPN